MGKNQEEQEEQPHTSMQELLHNELILIWYVFGWPTIYWVSISMVDFGFLMGFDFGFYFYGSFL